MATNTDGTAAAVAAEIETMINAEAHSSGDITDNDLDKLIFQCLPEPKVTKASSVVSEPAVVDSVAVRGIRSFGPEQTLWLSEGLTIVYAGNGKGKTSLTDALELITGGATTRRVSLPNAAAEVRDKDHITHRTPTGGVDPANPPRVHIRYRNGQELRSCEWTKFGSPATHPPDLQILPRRLLRELVNAKRTERTEPLGAALGLADTIESWTAIAKELRTRAAAAREEAQPHLKLLSDEVPIAGSDAEQMARIQRWEQMQSPHSETLNEPPEPGPWQKLAQDLTEDKQPPAGATPLGSEFESLLRSFIAVVEPDTTCPACAQASVPAARIDEVRALLTQSRKSVERAALATELLTRCDDLAAKTSAWLELTAPPAKTSDEFPSSWTAAMAKLQRAIDARDQLGNAKWSREVAEALETLRNVHAQLTHDSEDEDSAARHRAITAVRADTLDTLERLREREFRRTALSPLLERADARTRTLLINRVNDEFKALENPINEWLGILGPEGTPRITLEPVLTQFRPSLNLRVAEYPEITTAPHVSGHFSDAQIDMLGMATHLARIERDHPGSTILIDDPSDMLDSAARRSLAQQGISRLLDDESGPAHQVVILTHDDHLVRDLWDGHRDRKPATVQDSIERRRSEDGEDYYSMLTSRNAADAVARADELATNYWEAHQDRLWFRAALAAHTRQAAEMCAKDISTLLGPVGLDLHPDGRCASESADLGKVGTQIRATLRETTESWCNAGRHIQARKKIDEIRDLFSKNTSAVLNPGAHADVVLPEAVATRETLSRLKKIVSLLDAPLERPRSIWTTESELAIHLSSGAKCLDCKALRTDETVGDS